MAGGPNVFVVLFRGVGGPTRLPTAPLREALTAGGFDNVATYINSGNAVLKTRLSSEATVATIAKLCAKRFSFDKAIYAISRDEWSGLIDRNPFAVAPDGGKFLSAAWLAKEPVPADVAALKALATDGDCFETVGRVAYISTPKGFSNSRLAASFDRRIGVPNTARNWNTVLKLAELAAAAD